MLYFNPEYAFNFVKQFDTCDIIYLYTSYRYLHTYNSLYNYRPMTACSFFLLSSGKM